MSAPAHPERPTLFDLPLDAPSLAQTLDTLGGWISQAHPSRTRWSR
ncbi:hypothetical protein [Deinococcus radiophilus]